MTETELSQQLQRETEPPALAPGFFDEIRTVGLAARRRRRRTATGLAVLAAAALAAAGGTAPLLLATTHHPTTLAAERGASPSPSVPSRIDGETAPYWSSVIHYTGAEPAPGGDYDYTASIFLGHDRPGAKTCAPVTARDCGGALVTPAFPGPDSELPGTGWDGLWNAPQTEAGLSAWIYEETGQKPGVAVLNTWSMITHFMLNPGPASTRRLLGEVAADLPGVTASTGADALGRPAKILTCVCTTGGDITPAVTTASYLDPETGTLLEQQGLVAVTGKVGFRAVTVALGPTESEAQPAPAVVAGREID